MRAPRPHPLGQGFLSGRTVFIGVTPTKTEGAVHTTPPALLMEFSRCAITGPSWARSSRLTASCANILGWITLITIRW